MGLLGGAFNPIHIGHLVLAQEAWHKFGLDKVIFIPTHIPPHKDVEDNVSAADRLNMVRLALEGDKRFEISTYELDRKRVSYSIDTIKHFKEKLGPECELFFLTGSDWAKDLSTWKEIDEILELTTFVIATRPGWEDSSSHKDRTHHIVIPGVDVSSSIIRERVRSKEPIDYLAPSAVVKYVRNKGLYRGE